jgi:hypothetical protein
MSKTLAKRSPEVLAPKEHGNSCTCFNCRDKRVRDWVRTVQNWTAIARDCVGVKVDKSYEQGGFKTWEDWLLSAAPEEKSRSYLYLVSKNYLELTGLIPENEIDGVKLGCVTVLKQTSPEIRRDPRVLAAAKDKPEKLREVLERDFPEQHIETTVNKRCRFPRSMWEHTIEPKYETFLLIEPDAGFESFIEWLCTE